jgi:hypothetical protein
VSLRRRALEELVKTMTPTNKMLANSGTKTDNLNVMEEVWGGEEYRPGEPKVMRVPSAYVHALEGRLRIKVVEVKGNEEVAWEVEARLSTVTGVDKATANPRTGNVLVLYDPAETSHGELVEALQSWGFLQPDQLEAASHRGVGIGRDTLANTLVRSSVEFALQRLFTALI